MTTPSTGSLTDRVWTAFLPRRSALRRPSDRAEIVARWLAAALLATAVPFLLALGSAHTQDLRDASALTRATAHPVTATVVGATPQAGALGGVPNGAVDVTATWTAPDGTPHTATGVASRGARVGDPWSAWVDGTGRQVPPPRSDAQAVTEGVLLALWSAMAVVVAVAALLALLHLALDRRRFRDWDEDWALFCLGRHRGTTG